MGSAAEAVARYGMIRHTSEKCACAVCVCACSLHRLWDCSVAQHAKLRFVDSAFGGAALPV